MGEERDDPMPSEREGRLPVSRNAVQLVFIMITGGLALFFLTRVILVSAPTESRYSPALKHSKRKDADPVIPPCNGNDNFLAVQAHGRLGNLLFEYAAVLGMCLSRGLDPKTCPRIVAPAGAKSSPALPLDRFIQEFSLPSHALCASKTVYYENSATPQSVAYDPAVLTQPINSTFVGFYQSHRYFAPHAAQAVRNAFKFSARTTVKAEAFMSSVQREVAAVERRAKKQAKHELVCMSVRRGDKTNADANPIYLGWPLSSEYYLQALNVFKKRYNKLVVVVFSGGSMNATEDAEDHQWVQDRIIARARRPATVFLNDSAIAGDDMASLKALSLCPHIVTAASSFSWWAAWLAGHDNVVASSEFYAKSKGFVASDYYPANWTLISKQQRKPSASSSASSNNKNKSSLPPRGNTNSTHPRDTNSLLSL